MIDRFVADRRGRWERLEALLARRRRGARLAADDLEELGRLYRRSTSDLAIARRDFPGDPLTHYLEQLVARAHPAIYRRAAGDPGAPLRFFARGFPRAFRESWRYTALAFALFALPLAAAFVATQLDPINGRIIVASRPFVERVERGESWLEVESSTESLMASFIMTNNIQVAFLAFAGGALFGLGSVFVLVFNGLSIGAVAGLANVYGLGPELVDFVAAHGGIELSVIFIAGGAGLRLGHALLAPDLLPRRQALALAARQAIRLLLGCVPLLVVAGAIEGFVSPSALPTAAKLAVGLGSTVVLYLYLLLAGRSPPPIPKGQAAMSAARGP
jgi:uncharacterized membrane protein SpoIIM required for sporulation